MKRLLIAMLILVPVSIMAQLGQAPKDTSWKTLYRATPTKINDLVHTKLDVKFDYENAWMFGKAWITLKPHFYATDSLQLDAKGMSIKEVAIMKGATKTSLKYAYDGMFLNIKLDKVYTSNENYIVYIDYVSKPNDLKVKGSAAISDAKGLYFINPKGDDADKPTQIWTQGETEATSVWCPTIDRPNQKCTDEIYMTVPSKYVTLSNGLLMSQKKNTDGTRTDYWKMDLPHSPYLFFMGVGDFAIIKDKYKNKEVSYYVEPKYAPVARKIFGNTPEMMKFFSEKLGVDYPWQKYAQIVGRDYVSGAMENTTATLHQESAYQTAKELVDGIGWDGTIAHELFHQWFGDYVTAESWSNLTVNESMADYSQTLWAEYKHGKDAGDEENEQGKLAYLGSKNDAKKNLVRFHYADKEDMFDLVSYQKGGRVLHMLRNYVGDDAFFKSLNNYLTTNKFKNGESDQMRLAFEEVTGQDLSWFWNQWYFGNGHPELKISYNYDDAAGKATVTVEQTQTSGKIFRLPFAIDVYNGAAKKRYNVWMEKQLETYTFDYTQRPDLINVDADKILLAKITDDKTTTNYIHQIKYAKNYIDRKDAIQYLANKQDDKAAYDALQLGLKDPFYGLRNLTMSVLDFKKNASVLEPTLVSIAKTDKKTRSRARALSTLADNFPSAAYENLFKQYLNDSSAAVCKAALKGLATVNPAAGKLEIEKRIKDADENETKELEELKIIVADESEFDKIIGDFKKMPLSNEKFQQLGPIAKYVAKLKDLEKIKKGIEEIAKFGKSIPEQFRGFTDGPIKAELDNIAKGKDKEIQDYVNAQWK